jgi:hypothetical protein
MINRLKNYPNTNKHWLKNDKGPKWFKLNSGSPENKDGMLEGYKMIAEDQTLLIAEMEQVILGHKKVMKAQTVKIQKLIGYIERILGRKLNAPKKES